MNKIKVSVLALACSLSIPANAATIAVTYSFDGGQSGPRFQLVRL
jgi:hypothetical protein